MIRISENDKVDLYQYFYQVKDFAIRKNIHTE